MKREEPSCLCATFARLLALAVVFGVASIGTSLAQDDANETDEDDRDLDSDHCVRINDIDKIDIVDADTLVFRMRGGKVYRTNFLIDVPG